jgi:hypothetical protein
MAGLLLPFSPSTGSGNTLLLGSSVGLALKLDDRVRIMPEMTMYEH